MVVAMFNQLIPVRSSLCLLPRTILCYDEVIKSKTSQNMSTIYTVDWAQYLSPDSELPPDVIFNVVQSSGTYKGGSECVNHIFARNVSVRAHKLILAAVSPVFRRMFFSTDTNFTLESEEITIMDSDCFAFQKMINYIYSKDYSCDDIRDSFEILKMGDKYDLKELVILSRRSIDNYVISGQNVAKVLHVVEVYKNLEGFDDICEGLLARCRKFVSDSMRTAQDVFNLLAINSDEDDEVETDLLVKLLRETARCRNCKMHPNECLNGQKVKILNIRF